MSRPRISIITPSFNQGIFIEKTIRSVLDQGYPELEFIIIDGGSSDQSREVISKYAAHLKFWVSEPDKGQSDAINKGMHHATGDIIQWLNSDDYLEPGSLELLAEMYEREPGKDVFVFHQRIVHGDTPAPNDKTGHTPYDLPIEEMLKRAHIDQPATWFRGNVFRSLFPLHSAYHYTMDAELWCRYLLRYGKDRIAWDPGVIVNFRIHEGSKTGSAQERFFMEKKNLSLQVLYAVSPEKELVKAIQSLLTEKKIIKDIPLYPMEVYVPLDQETLADKIVRELVYDIMIAGDKALAKRAMDVFLKAETKRRFPFLYLKVKTLF